MALVRPSRSLFDLEPASVKKKWKDKAFAAGTDRSGMEKAAEEFYDQIADDVEERGIQDLLRYLASVEHGHYFLLKGEYELSMKDEAYMEREDFQYDMVHIGP